MYKEKKIIICMMFLIFLLISITSLNTSFVSANLACGLVETNETEIQLGGFEVQVYYKENFSDRVSCYVSPEGKYCCDLLSLRSPFSVNKSIVAEIFDESTGLVALRKETKTTSQGYTLFPNLFLEEAIKFGNLTSKVQINSTKYTLSAKLVEPFENVSVFLNNLSVFKCNNCSEFNVTFDLDKGKNLIEIIAENERKIRKEISAYSLDFFQINKKINCSSCKNNRVGSDEIFELINYVNSSHNIDGMIEDFIPSDFEILSDVFYINMSEGYKRVYSYLNSSSNYTFSYFLRSPKVRFPTIYEIKTSFFEIENSFYLKVGGKFFPFYLKKVNFPYNISSFYTKEKINNKIYRISPNVPVILKEEFFTLAIFSEKEGKANFFLLRKTKEKGLSEEIRPITNLKKEDIERFVLYPNFDNLKNRSIYLNKNGTIIKLTEKNTEGYFIDNNNFFIIIKKE